MASISICCSSDGSNEYMYHSPYTYYSAIL
jgi:hypothetical protein